MSLRYNFNGGSNGESILVGEAMPNEWDTIDGGFATRQYSQVPEGFYGMHGKIAAPAETVVALKWGTQFGSLIEHYSRMYVYVTANPPTGVNLPLMCWTDEARNPLGRVWVATSGKLRMSRTGFTPVATSGPAIPLNQWVRLEWFVVNKTSLGALVLRVFHEPDAGTPTYTLESPTGNSGTSANGFGFGVIDLPGGTPPTFYIDGCCAAGATWFGPETRPGSLPTGLRYTLPNAALALPQRRGLSVLTTVAGLAVAKTTRATTAGSQRGLAVVSNNGTVKIND